jgi:dTDP-L-rhamnose 4-epimerase
MRKRILITGGAGFIGSHIADELIAAGWVVRALDNLEPQVHGPDCRRPDYLHPDVELQRGDVRDRAAVARALVAVDAVIHLAARVGVGQSMYDIVDYTSGNALGTATLLQALARQPVARLVVASSMSVYGEGLYRDGEGRLQALVERDPDAARRGEWEPRDAAGAPLEPVPTPEWKQPSLASIYALGKYDQERMCLLIGRHLGIPTVALRLFNVYGSRQALSNPYTGVLAIFASRLLSGRRPVIFEDGRQRRDFVSVHDVVRAFAAALRRDEAIGSVINIGSGRSSSVREVAERLAAVLGREDLEPEVVNQYRAGDIRHCFADISRARELLGYQPRVSLEEGLSRLGEWLAGPVTVDRVAEMRDEPRVRGLAP